MKKVLNNQEIARILYEIGEYLDMQKVPFKPRAYEKAAESVESLGEALTELYARGGIKAVHGIPHVGASIAEKIEELLKSGRLKYYEDLKKRAPVDLSSLTQIQGLGPQKIRVLYEKLKVRSVEDLERAIASGKVAALPGFGSKSAENISKGIEFLKHSHGRFLLGSVLPGVFAVRDRLKKLREVKKIEIAGSVRRWRETIGDADLVVVSDNPKPVMDYFTSMPGIAMVIGHGDTKSSIKLRNGLQMDLRVVPEESYGAALAYFTGSKEHNIELRQIAIEKGFTLNEYGLYRGAAARKGKLIAGRTEEELYRALGLEYIPPEIREMHGEIEAARKHALPDLVGYGDLKGDLQVQTGWTDGDHSIETMALAAKEYGFQYIAITDHTQRLAMTGGLNEKKILKQIAEIDRLNRQFKNKNLQFKILKGTECDILEDGSLDLPDRVLAKLDVVGASVHSLFNLSKDKQMARIKKAMRNKHVDIFFHPTGRLIHRREPYAVDIDGIIKTAKETGTVLEIDGSPDRLDLKDDYIRKCVEAGVKMSVDSDAHGKEQYRFTQYGIAQARRGWATKKDIINCWPADTMLNMLK